MNQSDFKTPCAKYKMNTIVHAWPKEYKLLVDAIKAFGYGGCATNPEYPNGCKWIWEKYMMFMLFK